MGEGFVFYVGSGDGLSPTSQKNMFKRDSSRHLALGWPILVVSMLGLADSAFDFRRRFAGFSGQRP